jgi:hypothetical protein
MESIFQVFFLIFSECPIKAYSDISFKQETRDGTCLVEAESERDRANVSAA